MRVKSNFAKEFQLNKLRKKFSFLLHEYQAQELLNSFKVATPKVSDVA